jgi:hypothetical protein
MKILDLIRLNRGKVVAVLHFLISIMYMDKNFGGNIRNKYNVSK